MMNNRLVRIAIATMLFTACVAFAASESGDVVKLPPETWAAIGPLLLGLLMYLYRQGFFDRAPQHTDQSVLNALALVAESLGHLRDIAERHLHLEEEEIATINDMKQKAAVDAEAVCSRYEALLAERKHDRELSRDRHETLLRAIDGWRERGNGSPR